MAQAVDTHSALETLPFWIGGKAIPATSARTGDVTNPATGNVIRRVPMATAADVDTAVRAARAAFPAWRDTPPQRRARVLQKFLALLRSNGSHITRIVSEEHGKTLPDAVGSLERGIEVVEFACGIPHLLKGEHAENVGTGIDAYTLRQPLGVCAGITPFNFPVMVPLWMFPSRLHAATHSSSSRRRRIRRRR
jgi:malonate-semialdehyde dehydrogenase (acetylating)/methylmalonate-semialdehyde dehydrogenase